MTLTLNWPNRVKFLRGEIGILYQGSVNDVKCSESPHVISKIRIMQWLYFENCTEWPHMHSVTPRSRSIFLQLDTDHFYQVWPISVYKCASKTKHILHDLDPVFKVKTPQIGLGSVSFAPVRSEWWNEHIVEKCTEWPRMHSMIPRSMSIFLKLDTDHSYLVWPKSLHNCANSATQSLYWGTKWPLCRPSWIKSLLN